MLHKYLIKSEKDIYTAYPSHGSANLELERFDNLKNTFFSLIKEQLGVDDLNQEYIDELKADVSTSDQVRNLILNYEFYSELSNYFIEKDNRF